MVVVLFVTSLPAQTAGNLYVGYSFVSNDLHISKFLGEEAAYSAKGRGNLSGWNFSGEIKAFRWIGVVADFNGTYGSVPINFLFNPVVIHNPPTSVNTTFYTYLFGPRVSVKLGKIRPFAEALVGVASQSLNLGVLDSEDKSNLATAFGGGLDYRFMKLLAWRVEADYVSSRLFKDQDFYSAPVQRNFRLSTGISEYYAWLVITPGKVLQNLDSTQNAPRGF
jgi:opacity protein-like surface antigen